MTGSVFLARPRCQRLPDLCSSSWEAESRTLCYSWINSSLFASVEGAEPSAPRAGWKTPFSKGQQGWGRFWRDPRGNPAPLARARGGITAGGHAWASEKSGRQRGLTPTPSHGGAEEIRAATGTLFSSWKTLGCVSPAPRVTSFEVFCPKTAPGLGVAEGMGRF